MAERDVFEKWLEARRRENVPQGFTHRIMERVMAMEVEPRANRPGVHVPGPVARLALAASLSALGVFRLADVAWKLFCP